MPQIVVNQDMKDYVAYAKKKGRDELHKSIATIFIFLGAMGFVFWILWDMVHIGS